MFFCCSSRQTPAATTAPVITTKATTKATTATPKADKEVAKTSFEHVCTAACKTGTSRIRSWRKRSCMPSACAAPKIQQKKQ